MSFRKFSADHSALALSRLRRWKRVQGRPTASLSFSLGRRRPWQLGGSSRSRPQQLRGAAPGAGHGLAAGSTSGWRCRKFPSARRRCVRPRVSPTRSAHAGIGLRRDPLARKQSSRAVRLRLRISCEAELWALTSRHGPASERAHAGATSPPTTSEGARRCHVPSNHVRVPLVTTAQRFLRALSRYFATIHSRACLRCRLSLIPPSSCFSSMRDVCQ